LIKIKLAKLYRAIQIFVIMFLSGREILVPIDIQYLLFKQNLTIVNTVCVHSV